MRKTPAFRQGWSTTTSWRCFGPPPRDRATIPTSPSGGSTPPPRARTTTPTTTTTTKQRSSAAWLAPPRHRRPPLSSSPGRAPIAFTSWRVAWSWFPRAETAAPSRFPAGTPSSCQRTGPGAARSWIRSGRCGSGRRPGEWSGGRGSNLLEVGSSLENPHRCPGTHTLARLHIGIDVSISIHTRARTHTHTHKRWQHDSQKQSIVIFTR
mmetsp:Transcript_20483/g.42780  ORF Transcript_20483/g.42780 Transcript_20483/m.42780 type:complete len:209 (+) Transcript_20483:1393-2019(+)